MRPLARPQRPLTTGFVGAIANEFAITDMADLRALVTTALRGFDPTATVSTSSGTCFAIQLRAHDAPFTVFVEAIPFDGPPLLSEVSFNARRRVVIATSVRSGAPSFRVMPHTRWRRAIAALRPRGHVRTGDAAFDGRFVTRGSPEATALLAPAVRRGLLALAETHPVFLECTRGAVEVRWYTNPTAATLTQALDIAASVRSASALAR